MLSTVHAGDELSCDLNHLEPFLFSGQAKTPAARPPALPPALPALPVALPCGGSGIVGRCENASVCSRPSSCCPLRRRKTTSRGPANLPLSTSASIATLTPSSAS